MEGICVIPAIPMRKEPSHRSELVSQLLFGDMYSIAEQTSNWLKIRSADDRYEGWIDMIQHFTPGTSELERLKKVEHYFTADLTNIMINMNDGTEFLLSAGSRIYGKHEFSIGDIKFKYTGHTFQPEFSDVRKSILQTARKFLHVPYIWGGKTTMGLDCSGFTQIIYRVHNINLERDAGQQCSDKPNLSLRESKPGDLAFFGDNEKITHVGIISEAGKIIHCSGKVRIDNLDETGIFQTDSGRYTHYLKYVRSALE